MLGPIEKSDFKPGEGATRERADDERGGSESSGEPRGSVRQLVPQGQENTDSSHRGERDPGFGCAQKPW
jgi:hypothetical protein